MDTREELHAVLDELDSDELPAPEALRLALRSEVLRPAFLSAFNLEALNLRQWDALPESLNALRNLESLHIAPASLLLPEVATHLAALAAALGLPAAVIAAYRTHLEDVAQTRAGGPSSQRRPELEEVPAKSTVETEQPRRTPRKLPRSLGMGRGPAGLSEREGFAALEDGEPD